MTKGARLKNKLAASLAFLGKYLCLTIGKQLVDR